ncbi:hypothetical protein [Pseudomonas sp. HS6]|uniref:hypothetical protein n=1 Tax=Pseudomonas sp. HS6 TaxID=2850559 RepID=UPI0020195A0F|nr:hypothetical protein [Pseudomonas sp. HS6]UQS17561.1 hypothetical protein JJN09_12085 [Pseudomonas sp. HS6]
MPITQNTPLSALVGIFPTAITAYNTNKPTANYNLIYNAFIIARQSGISLHGGLYNWIHFGNATATIHDLLAAFGMNKQSSALVKPHIMAHTLKNLQQASLKWIEHITLPISAPCNTINPNTGKSLSLELSVLYTTLSAPGAITVSGGFVAASKTMHCLFPNLAPMIDGRHSGLSYFHILQSTYTPPLGIKDWVDWVGAPLPGVPNPSPRGAGRYNWDAARFLAAIAVNQHIYEIWQQQNGSPGLRAFLAIDPVSGTSGIPRIIDKLLW